MLSQAVIQNLRLPGEVVAGAVVSREKQAKTLLHLQNSSIYHDITLAPIHPRSAGDDERKMLDTSNRDFLGWFGARGVHNVSAPFREGGGRLVGAATAFTQLLAGRDTRYEDSDIIRALGPLLPTYTVGLGNLVKALLRHGEITLPDLRALAVLTMRSAKQVQDYRALHLLRWAAERLTFGDMDKRRVAMIFRASGVSFQACQGALEALRVSHPKDVK